MNKQYFNASLWLILCGFVLGLTACQCNPSQTESFPVQGDFYIRYLKEKSQFSVLSSFTYLDSVAAGQSDTTNYKITFMGRDLTKRVTPTDGLKYALTTQMPFNSTLPIKILHPDGNLIEKQTLLYAIDSIVGLTELKLSQSNQINWSGQPLKDNETIIVLLTSADNKTITTTINGPTTTNAIPLSEHQLDGLGTGLASLYLVRTQSSRDSQDLMKLEYRLEYFTNTYTVPIVK